MIRGLLFLLLSCSLMSSNDPNLPKWANADSWNLKICDNMTEGQILSLLGPPRLIWETDSQATWFYQDLPKITHSEKGISAKDKIVNQSLSMPKSGYLLFNKSKKSVEYKDGKSKVVQPITEQNRESFMHLMGESPSKYKIVHIPSPEFRLNKWVVPNWEIVAASGATAYELVKPKPIMPTDSSDRWKSFVNWRKIKPGMSIEKCKALLGEPVYDEKPKIGQRIWYYTSLDGVGVVNFIVSKDRPEYIINSWSEPYWPQVESSGDQSQKGQ